MYCERCNIDFSEGLRYCKWCGEALKERGRDTSELKTCPSCKAAVKSSWTFCKSCGTKLSATAVTTTSPVGSETASTPVVCSNCGELLDSTSLYCKGCGSPVKQAAEMEGASSMLCAACNSYSPVGSSVCTVCGFPFAASVPQRTERAPNTLIDSEENTGTRPDLAARISQPEIPTLPDATVEMASYPAPSAPVDDQATRAIITSEPTDRIKPGGGATGPQSLDNLKTVVMESDTVAIDQETLIMDADTSEIRPAIDTQLTGEERTIIMQGTQESMPEKSVKTTILDRGRTTGAVEDDGADGGGAADNTSTRPISEMDAPPDPLGQTIVQFEASPGERTDPLGAIPPPPGTESRPESLTAGTSVIGSGAPAPPAPQPPAFTESQTETIEHPGPPTPDPRTAPFGLDQTPQPPPSGPVAQQPWPGQQGFPPQAEMPATRMMPAPAQPTRTNLAPIISVVAVVLVLAVAGIAAWWYFVGGPSTEPARQEEVMVNPPAPEPPPQPPPPEVKTPAIPEGMVLVPGGKYIVGRDDGDELAKPQRTIDIAPFYIDITEVTNAQYMLFVDATKRNPPAGWQDGKYPEDRANWPVTGVTWQDAADYAAWARKRLPTEIEWEAAARGPEGRLYPWGNEWRRGLANIGTSGIREVGQFKQGASPFGALDMIGNVWEWTADELALYPGSTAELPSSVKPEITYRIIRGGAYDGTRETDASYRGFVDFSQGYPKTGFRCVRDAR